MGKGKIISKGGVKGFYKILLYSDIETAKLDLSAVNRSITRISALSPSPARTAALFSLYAKKDILQAIIDDETKEVFAWCADQGEMNPGELVGVVEIDRMYDGVWLNIYPAYFGEQTFSPERDGIMKKLGAINKFTQFYNWCLLPAAKKWKPRYRHGVAYDIDKEKDTCNVRLYEYFDKPDSLNVNLRGNLYSVPIVYMNCNSQPFETNDDVLVKFENNDWDKPRVIGFAHNPKPCGEYAYCRLYDKAFIWDIEENQYLEGSGGIGDYIEKEDYIAAKGMQIVDINNDYIETYPWIWWIGAPPGTTRPYSWLRNNSWLHGIYDKEEIDIYISQPDYKYIDFRGGYEYIPNELLGITENKWDEQRGVITSAGFSGNVGYVREEEKLPFTDYIGNNFPGAYTRYEITAYNEAIHQTYDGFDSPTEYNYRFTDLRYERQGNIFTERSMIQVFFTEWVPVTYLMDPRYYVITGEISRGARVRVVSAKCSTYPFLVDDEESINPFEQPRNPGFETALNGLIDAARASLEVADNHVIPLKFPWRGEIYPDMEYMGYPNYQITIYQ